jgi:ABC-2 type transport system permease protein
MLSAPIRTAAPAGVFVGELFRQPGQLFIVIFGPCLILLAFVLGARVYRDFPTTNVVEPSGGANPVLRSTAADLDNFLRVVDVTPDRGAALDRLRHGEVKLVLELPADPQAAIQRGEQAQIQITTNEIDPLANSFATLFVESQIAELNRQTIEKAAAQLRDRSTPMRTDLDRVARLLDEIDTGALPERRQRLVEAGALLVQIDDGLGQLEDVGRLAGGATANGPIVGGVLAEQRQRIARLRADLQALDAPLGFVPSPAELARMRGDVAQLRSLLDQVQGANPTALSAPFAQTVTNVAPYQPQGTNYFLPGILALILQHLALTLAAVSIARDRRLGILDVYRLSPAGAGELLLGKYVGLSLMVALIAAGITALAIGALHLAVLGGLLWLVVALFVFLLTALAFGFVIGLLTGSEEAAIQVSMLVLIASVAFGGLLAPLEQLSPPLLAAAYALPVTAGKVVLEAVMFRGYLLDWMAPAILLALLSIWSVLSFRLFSVELARR